MRVFIAVVAFLGTWIACPLLGQSPETEPNDSPATATRVDLGTIAGGMLTKPDPNSMHNQDWWSFHAEAGDTLRFEWDEAVVPSGYLNGIMRVRMYAGDGTFLVEPRTESTLYYVIKTSGRYYLELSAATQYGDDYYEFGLWTNRHPKPPCEVASDREPNDADGGALDINVGDRIDGVLCPSRDRDTYRFHATRRTRIQIRIDRDTGSKPSSWGNPSVSVSSYGMYVHGKSDWRNGSVLEFWVPETGDYYASVATRGGVNIKYALKVLAVGSVPTGPGEPVATRSENLGYTLAFAVAPSGDWYVSEYDRTALSSNIIKISPTSYQRALVTRIQGIVQSLAFDAAGNLLAASDQILYRVSPSGQSTPLLNTAACPWCPGGISAIAVARDGTIWFTSPWGQIKRLDRDGHFMDSTSVLNGIDPNPFGLGYLALAPDGTPYFASGNAIYRLVSGSPELFVRDTAEADQAAGANAIGGFAFDVEGNLYVTHPFSGGINLYDRMGAQIWGPYAWVPSQPRAVAFGRNADGSTSRRLFVLGTTNVDPPGTRNGTIFELYSSDGRPPGRPEGLTVQLAARELVRPNDILNAAQRAYLDFLGNNDGRYDVGDFRAFLQRETGVSASPR